MVISAAVAAVAGRGQSIWLDDLSRDLLTSGELARWIQEGVSGITTNPTIFEHAITASRAYDRAIEAARANGPTCAFDLYEALVIEDVRWAADLLADVYRQTGGADGFVSLEVRPALSFDGEATFVEACRLWARVSRPNLMIKLPATPQGIAVIPRLVAAGVNVNATLIFSPQTYRRVVDAYMDGLEARLAARMEVASVAGVASFFVSRIDARVDGLLAQSPVAAGTIDPLRGRAALAFATLAYDAYRHALASTRGRRLAQAGARPQRLLWASLAPKNPADAPTRYVRQLVYPGTVSTLPLDTYRAFRSEPASADALEPDVTGAQALLASLERVGIPVHAVSERLLSDGVDRFGQSFDRLLGALRSRCDAP